MAHMDAVYEQLVAAREEGLIPWDWLVDETRELERLTSYATKAIAYDTLLYNYRHPLWLSEEYDCEVWSEKGTIRGLIKEVLDEYRLGLRVFHGYNSATVMHEVATSLRRPTVALYVGDHDPSGCDMRESDIPKRLERYSEDDSCEVDFRVVALTMEQIRNPELNLENARVKAKDLDPRYDTYVKRHGEYGWELDALDPRTLRDLLKTTGEGLIDWEAWPSRRTIPSNSKRLCGIKSPSSLDKRPTPKPGINT
jgi:hypothetical protein